MVWQDMPATSTVKPSAAARTEYELKLDRLEEIEQFAARKGGNGAVYTQITDVEGELTGLITCDRKVLKADAK